MVSRKQDILKIQLSQHIILDNPIYAGKIVYGRYVQEKIKGERNKYRIVRRDDYDTYDGQHEAIISDEIWRAAQAKRRATGGKPLNHYGPKHVHLLSGIVRCPVCGSSMYGRISRTKKRDGSGYYDDRLQEQQGPYRQGLRVQNEYPGRSPGRGSDRNRPGRAGQHEVQRRRDIRPRKAGGSG